MNEKLLQRARAFEEERQGSICAAERPAFHLTGGVGWINDPNGFSFYKGEYHLFYQYHPFSNLWGPMHWGHAKSKDLLRWERLPIAMAPDESYDDYGCFSGSALELADGRHMLMYTGVQTIPEGDRRQTQCLAFGDGIDYQKYEHNPVITPECLPPGSSEADFRDPKIWQGEDGLFYAVMSAMNEEGNSSIFLFSSEDALTWKRESTLAESTAALGGMWECPDFFFLDGKAVLLVSPMAMMPDGKDFHVGHNTMAIIGSFDPETKQFTQETYQPIDRGIDFYAPQTMTTPDGRRVMIGWMQCWSNSKFVPPGVKYFGQLSMPRELFLKDGILCQRPIRELDAYHGERIFYENVPVGEEEKELPGVSGRLLDLTVTVKDRKDLKKLTIRLAANDVYHTDVTLIPKRSLLRLDRNFSGYLYDIVHEREIPLSGVEDGFTLRLILDRYSLEVFVGEGERCATLSLFTPQEALDILFIAEGKTVLDVDKKEIIFPE